MQGTVILLWVDGPGIVNLGEGTILLYVTWLILLRLKPKLASKPLFMNWLPFASDTLNSSLPPPISVTTTEPPTPFGWLAIPQPPMPPWPLSQWSEVNWNVKVSPATEGEGVALAEPTAKEPTAATAIATDPSLR